MKSELVLLVKSLSIGEKRAFALQCKKMGGEKVYLDLFQIINQASSHDVGQIVHDFFKKHPRKSFETTAQYLMKLISDTLIQLRMANDGQFQIFQSIMRARVFLERSLQQEAYKEIVKAKKLAAENQYHALHFLCARMELSFLSEKSYEEVEETQLVQLQTQAKTTLQLLRQIQEHYSLYEQLEYRLKTSGRSLSEHDKKKLNDLVLSELSLITRGVEKNFESQKLHLLFQSFFFTHTGDNKSAIQIFTQLNKLFEENESIWNQPPYDYLSTLEGILYSLRTMGHFEEMRKYLEKIKSLTQVKQSDHFKAACELVLYTNQLHILIAESDFRGASSLIQEIEIKYFKKSAVVDNDRFSELILYLGICFYHLREWKQAVKYLDMIAMQANQQSEIYKVSRLMNMVIHYEKNDQAFLEYDIRSYKRTFRKTVILHTEKLLFNLIKFDPHFKNLPNRMQFLRKQQTRLSEIRKDKYEQQLLKYFDFTAWAENKLAG